MKSLMRLGVLGGAVTCVFAGLTLIAAPAFGASTVSYSPSPFGSSLNVTGDAANDDLVSITQSDNTITVADSGTGGITTADPDCANAGGVAVTCPFDPPDPAPPADPTSPVTFMSASLQGANDTFISSVPGVQLSISGGDGDDILTGGPDNDSFDGGNGSDQIFGADGNDSMSGGGGQFSTGGSDLLDGNNGFDTGFYSRELAVIVSLNNIADDGFVGEGDNLIAERANGGGGNDVLTGNAEGNFLDGNDGNDVLVGLEGNDTLDGDAGDDALDGGAQRDQFECDDNFDTAIVDPRDVFDAECERTGAEVEGGTATVNKKSKTKVEVTCPVEEANACGGTLALFAGSKSLGSATFSVGAGFTGKAKLKLSEEGRNLLDKNGGTLLARAEAQTAEPIGTSVKEDEILLRRKPEKSGGK